MTFLHLIRSSIAAALLGGAASTAVAAAAVAVGDGNYTYTVTDDVSLAAAKASALEECSKRVDNCRILVSTVTPGAIALAKGKGGMSAWIEDTPEQARANAIAACRKKYKDCKFSALYWEQGGAWAAWASAPSDEPGVFAAYHLSVHFPSEQEAVADALAQCNKQLPDQARKCEVKSRFGDTALVVANSASYSALNLQFSLAKALAGAMEKCKAQSKPGEACKVSEQVVNFGRHPAPTSFAKVASSSELARETARQARPAPRQAATRTVRSLTCSNRCVNGSCVRTFPDGRSERWQAPRVFDPFTNDWKWDTSSCGG